MTLSHLSFDILAALASVLVTFLLSRRALAPSLSRIDGLGYWYYAALLTGAVSGAFILGTANLWLSDMPGIGRSILGAFLGAIVAVEGFKHTIGARGSTGALFVPAFTISVVIGRWGCFFTGLPDQTHGILTDHMFGYDFGDGPRHPVQLYESAAMAVAMLVWLFMIRRTPDTFRAYGFYLLCIWYGTERFLLEFLKPYGTLIGPLNVFHIGCALLIGYGIWMLSRARTAT